MDASPLGRLSPELRNIIYELCCQPSGHVSISKNMQPGITRASRQTRAESLLLSYSLPSAFVFRITAESGTSIHDLCKWLRAESQQHLDQIKELNICADAQSLPKRDGDEQELAWKDLALCLARCGFRYQRIKVEVTDVLKAHPDVPVNMPTTNTIQATVQGLRSLAWFSKSALRGTQALHRCLKVRGWLRGAIDLVEADKREIGEGGEG